MLLGLRAILRRQRADEVGQLTGLDEVLACLGIDQAFERLHADFDQDAVGVALLHFLRRDHRQQADDGVGIDEGLERHHALAEHHLDAARHALDEVLVRVVFLQVAVEPPLLLHVLVAQLQVVARDQVSLVEVRVVAGHTAQVAHLLEELLAQVPRLALVGQLVAVDAAVAVVDQLRDGQECHVRVGDQRNAVLDRQGADQLAVRGLVVVAVAGQDVDDQVEAVLLQEGADVRLGGIRDLVDQLRRDAVGHQEAVGAVGGEQVDVGVGQLDDGREEPFFDFCRAGTDQNVLFGAACDQFQVETEHCHGVRCVHGAPSSMVCAEAPLYPGGRLAASAPCGTRRCMRPPARLEGASGCGLQGRWCLPKWPPGPALRGAGR